MFNFSGEIAVSKSWLNRMRVIQYYADDLSYDKFDDLKYNSDISEDVRELHSAIAKLKQLGQKNALNTNQKIEFDLGLGGTSFRFFCFLLSRLNIKAVVKAHPKLLARPQHEIKKILGQLGVEVESEADGLRLHSGGWQVKTPVRCSGKESTQFLSGVLLNAWGLENTLMLQISKPILSKPYLEMTIQLLRKCGMEMSLAESENELQITVSRFQQPKLTSDLKPEIDASNLFSLAAAAVVNGQARVSRFNRDSLQPDFVFLELFKKMGISYRMTESEFEIKKHSSWNGLSVNLQNSPDLFPVLSALAALSGEASELFGASQLRHKESDRIAKTQELLTLLSFKSQERSDGLQIEAYRAPLNSSEVVFDPAHDHRMAMAAALFKLAGYQIRILNPEVVQKSYPQFWQDIGLCAK